MDDTVPWVTGLLTHMLITYMEEEEGAGSKISYRSVLSSVSGYERVSNARALLKDSHRWFPQTIFRELVRQCELLSGRKDIAYRAALHYFTSKSASSLLQIIARTLKDVKVTLSCAGLWAPAYSNYLRILCFEKKDWSQERGLIARFDPSMKPSVASIGMLRGNVEGFLQICDGIQEAECREEISQLRIEDLLEEFPSYHLTEEGGRLLIRELRSGEAVIGAKVVYLKSEEAVRSSPLAASEDEASLLPLAGGRVVVLTAEEEDDPQLQSEANRAYQITHGGTLFASPLSYTLPAGVIMNAPYSRLRCTWKESSNGSMETGVSTKSSDFLPELLLDHLLEVRENQERILAETRENFRLRQENRPAHPYGIISQSRRMEKVFEFIQALSQVESTVLVCGETGTGKELVARAIHESGARANKPFLAINCGALTESLLESELFGHEKGAFTGAATRKKGRFELAHGGSLFLDEVGEMSLEV
ncbi:MAG TPA: sigma-54 factor interaction domain-containing protein, partial [Nitrospiria bacterium]|nr:sigma-54 factor interaction domain-containing protein [Nitrospiria bacterium]